MNASVDTRIQLSHQENGLVLAQCEAQLVLGELEIIALDVLPTHRRRGLATRLLNDLMAKHQPHTVWLEVRVSNLAALELYKKLGFVAVGWRKNYYALADSDEREDASLMKKTCGEMLP